MRHPVEEMWDELPMHFGYPDHTGLAEKAAVRWIENILGVGPWLQDKQAFPKQTVSCIYSQSTYIVRTEHKRGHDTMSDGWDRTLAPILLGGLLGDLDGSTWRERCQLDVSAIKRSWDVTRLL
jgi:hypothetical protein